MLRQFVRDGSFVRFLHSVYDAKGYMPYGMAKEMLRGMEWQP